MLVIGHNQKPGKDREGQSQPQRLVRIYPPLGDPVKGALPEQHPSPVPLFWLHEKSQGVLD